MNLHSTLQRIALQLKNKFRTLKQVARVFQKIIKSGNIRRDFAS